MTAIPLTPSEVDALFTDLADWTDDLTEHQATVLVAGLLMSRRDEVLTDEVIVERARQVACALKGLRVKA